MNLLDDEVAEIARVVKLRLVSRGGSWLVYVRKDGVVALEKVGQERRKAPLPDADLVGCYTKRVQVQEITDDLEQRREELCSRSLA